MRKLEEACFPTIVFIDIFRPLTGLLSANEMAIDYRLYRSIYIPSGELT